MILVKNKKLRTIALFSCGFAMVFCGIDYFIQVAPSIMIETLMMEFGITAAGIGLLSSVFYYSYMVMQIPAGLLVDHYGAKKILFIAVVITAAGMILFSIANTFSLAIVGRSLTGLGSAFAFLCSLYFAATWFEKRYFALMAGLTQLTVSIGSIIGGAPLAFMSDQLGWRQALFLVGIITFCLALGILLIARDNTDYIKNNKLPGQHWWQSLKLILKNHQVWWISSCSLISWLPVATVGALWGIPYLSRVYELTNTNAAMLLLSLWLAIGIGSPILGVLSVYLKYKKTLVFVCFSLGFLGACLLLLASFLHFYIIILALFLLGIAASIQAFSFSFIKDSMPHELFGAAAGIVNLFAIFGAALGQLLAGGLLQWMWNGTLVNGVPVYRIVDYQVALATVPVALLIGIVIARYKLKG